MDKEKSQENPKFVIDSNSGIKFQICHILGEGCFGKCYEFQNTITGRRYAAKVISKTKIIKKSQTLPNEIEIHSNLSHPSIVTLYYYFDDEINWYLILEYCRNGTLKQMLTERSVLTVSEVRYFMYQLLHASKYLHDNHIIHGDLKLQNILLNDNMKIKVGDFGLSSQFEDGELMTTICGTLSYMAPEILLKVGYDYKVDVWALGCIMYALLIGYLPFRGKINKEQKILAGKYDIPPNVPDPAQKLLKKLLEPNPDIRPNCREILKDYFFET